MAIKLETLEGISKVRLPGGVVGKVCLAIIVASVAIGGIGAVSRNEWIMGGAIGAILFLAFPMLWRLVSFAERNPQAALMEGAEFLVHQRLMLAAKGEPPTLVSPEQLTEERPVVLPPAKAATLNVPDDVGAPRLPGDTQ